VLYSKAKLFKESGIISDAEQQHFTTQAIASRPSAPCPTSVVPGLVHELRSLPFAAYYHQITQIVAAESAAVAAAAATTNLHRHCCS
jgi:hypothetical protein